MAGGLASRCSESLLGHQTLAMSILELCNCRQTQFSQPSILAMCFLWLRGRAGVNVDVGVCMSMCAKVRGWSQVLLLRTLSFAVSELLD